MEYKRLTTDNPISNDDALLNFAYAKDSIVVLRHAEGISDVDLCKFIQSRACDVTAEEIMEGACFECENFEYCEFGIAYTLGVQAAELREGLKMLEDKIENGEFVEQKQGEWVDRYKNKYDNHLYECSICNQEALWKVGVNELLSPTVTQALTPYCPHCNAKMRC